MPRVYPSDIAGHVAGHFDQPWQDVEREKREELERLQAAVCEPTLQAAARERLLEDAVRRILSRGSKDVEPTTHERLLVVLTARIQGAIESVRSELEKAHMRLRECERYLEIAPGWAQGCEMEVSLLERTVLRATVALADRSNAAAAAILIADVEHAALTSQISAYGRACDRRTQSVANALGHRNEASYLALRLVELAWMEPVPAGPDGRASP
jgi:hypothetical protein